jgi:hypothetical protein
MVHRSGLDSRRRYRRLAMLALAASAVALPAVPVIAGSDSWIGTSDGNWTDGTRWSNTVPPVGGDDVYITNTFSGTQTITYDYGGSPVTYNSVTVDATGGGTNVLLMPSNSLTVNTAEYIGALGVGNLDQTGGTNTCTLIVGNSSGSSGSYSLSGGTLETSARGPGVAGAAIGVSGVGSFYQSAGLHVIGGGFVLGAIGGSTGTYTLAGGIISAGISTDVVGYNGVGIFNQSDGNLTQLFMRIGETGGTGTYTLSGGICNTEYEEVGFNGRATFNQNGGTNQATHLWVGSGLGTDTYLLSGGDLTASSEEVGTFKGLGTFNQDGGSNTVTGVLYVGSPKNGPGNYYLSNGTLTIQGTASYETVGLYGQCTFAQIGGSNTMSGSAYLAIGITNQSSGSYALSGGSLFSGGGIFVGGGTNAAGGIGTLSVGGSGQLVTSGPLQIWRTGSVALGGPSTAFTTIGNLQIAGGGLLDVTNTALTINYGTNSSPNSTIRNYISNGYNAGATLWSGKGITSSVAAVDPAHHSVAFADGADGVVTNLPAGISSAIPNGGVLPAGTELVTYAFAGDANLDGKVDFNDFVAISTHFLQPDINWDHGNFNYDGVVDFNDFVILSTNFGEGVTGGDGVGATPAELAQFNAMATSFGISGSQIKSWDASIANLPEPGSAGLLAIGGLALLKRRRNRTS